MRFFAAGLATHTPLLLRRSDLFLADLRACGLTLLACFLFGLSCVAISLHRYVAAKADIFTDWMEEERAEEEEEELEAAADGSIENLSDPNNGMLGLGTDCGGAARFNAIKTMAQVVQANPGSSPTLQGGVLLSQYAAASKREKDIIKKVSRRWSHGSVRSNDCCCCSCCWKVFGVFSGCLLAPW